jgi:hypothetical protein
MIFQPHNTFSTKNMMTPGDKQKFGATTLFVKKPFQTNQAKAFCSPSGDKSFFFY